MTTATTDDVSIELRNPTPGELQIALGGRLESRTLTRVWDDAVDAVRQSDATKLTVDGSALTYCDGAGLGLFTELRRLAAARKSEVRFTGFDPGLQRLIDMSLLKDPLAGQLAPPRPDGVVIQTGKAAAGILQDMAEMIGFVGELLSALVWALLHPLRVRWRDVLTIAEKAGANALGVVSLLGLLVGVILAFQTAGPLERFGAQPLIPMIVSISVLREMGPLITAVILAGRSGSAFAAEIGTMKVTEELAALKTMGMEPTQFLIVPRVLAAVIVTPLLTVFNILMSLFGGYLVMAGLGYSLPFYINSVRNAVNVGDFAGGIFKAFVFALIIAGIGCLRGTQTGSGPGAVGDSTTRAVVAGIVLTIVADAVLGVVYFYVGI